MSSSGSTSDSRYDRPLGPADGPMIEDTGWSDDSLRQERPFDVTLLRRDEVLSAGVEDEAAAGVAAAGLDPAAGTGPACCDTSAVS